MTEFPNFQRSNRICLKNSQKNADEEFAYMLDVRNCRKGFVKDRDIRLHSSRKFRWKLLGN